jgi:hypothetical protein
MKCSCGLGRNPYCPLHGDHVQADLIRRVLADVWADKMFAAVEHCFSRRFRPERIKKLLFKAAFEMIEVQPK